MYISSIDIENVRCFLGDENATLPVPALPGWYVFAGRNGAGKSTLLRAVAVAVAGPDFARQLMPTFATWIREPADTAVCAVRIQHHPDFDKLSGAGKAPRKPLEAGLAWARSADGPEPVLAMTALKNEDRPHGPWRGPWSANPQGWLVIGYGPFRRLTGHAAEAQRDMSGSHHVRRLVSLFREDASLQEAVQWLKNVRFRELEGDRPSGKLLAYLRSLLNSGLLPDGARVVDVTSAGLKVQRDGVLVELNDLSDGYRVVLALVLDIIRHMHDAYGAVRFGASGERATVEMPGVVLIDEVDAHLHVEWQQRIGPWLVERFPQVQFLVTTHSPFVCQSASPGGLFRLPAPGEQRGVEPVSEETYNHVVNGTVDDAVLTDLFGLEHSQSKKAVLLTKEFSELEAKRLRKGLAPAERKRLDLLRRQLPLPFEPSAAE